MSTNVGAQRDIMESTVRLKLMNVNQCPVAMVTAVTTLTATAVTVTLDTLESTVRQK